MNIIKYLRKERGLTQKQLADRLDIAERTVSHWEQNLRQPNSTQRKKLANFFNCAESDLLKKEPAYSVHSRNVKNKAPIISWKQANEYNGAIANGEYESVYVPDIDDSNIFALKIKTANMAPLFAPGYIIVINPNKSARSDKYVLVKDTKGSEAIFAQYKDYGDFKMLHFINEEFEDIPMTSQFKIIGRVIGKVTFKL